MSYNVFEMSDIAPTEIYGTKEQQLRLWPSRDLYFDEMEQEIVKNKDGIAKKLIENGVPNDCAEETAVIVIRGQHTFNFLSRITNLENKVHTEIIWSKGIGRNIRAQASPVLTSNGKILEKEDLDKGVVPSLEAINIGVNLNEIVRQVRSSNRYYKLALEKYPDEYQVAEDIKKDILTKSGIHTELAIVEEVAHALYISTVFKTQNQIINWLKNMKDYQSQIPGTEDSLIVILSPEEQALINEKYHNKKIEVKADILKSLFQKKYHPGFVG